MKRILFALILLGFANDSFAQNKNIIVLGSKKNTTTSDRKKNQKWPSMAVKVGALNFIAGNLPICFEKEYHNFSLLVGAGPTFHRFYDNSFWSGIFDENDVVYSFNAEQMSTVNNPFNYDSRPKFKYTPSYYFVVNPRYYYNEEGMDGGYFGLQYVMSQYSYSNPGIGQTAFTKPGRDRYTDILVQWGAQYGDNKMVFEWFTGLGVRFKDEMRYASAIDFNGNLLEGTAQIKKSAIRYDMGFRVGFKF